MIAKVKLIVWVATHSISDREVHHDCCQQSFYGSTKNKVLKQLLKFLKEQDYFEHYDYISVKSQLKDKGYFWFYDGEYTVEIKKIEYD